MRCARTLLLVAGVLAGVLTLAGCGQPKQLTLREAEEIGQLWLDDLSKFLEPVKAAQEAHGDGESGARAKEEETATGPKALRDCFVNDGWKPDGFPNPVAAINWLTQTYWKVGEMTSAELADGGTEIDFRLSGKESVRVHARIVVEGGAAKCQSLKKSE